MNGYVRDVGYITILVELIAGIARLNVKENIVLDCTNDTTLDNAGNYTLIEKPHELSLEEKNQLIFTLLNHLNLAVMRANFDSTFTILVKKV